MIINALNMTIDETKDSAAQLAKYIERHPSLQDALRGGSTITVYDADAGIEYELQAKDGTVTIIRQIATDEVPVSADALIVEDGFCRHGDALERTKDLQVPDSLYDDNYRECKRSRICGCVQCGSIFPGSAVENMSGSAGGRDGMAFCPFCGSNTVIAEDSGVEINGDNLWRWNQHTFGEMPMYKDLPDDLSKLSLADVMRHLQ